MDAQPQTGTGQVFGAYQAGYNDIGSSRAYGELSVAVMIKRLGAAGDAMTL